MAKKEKKSGKITESTDDQFDSIGSVSELKDFLMSIRDKMSEETCPPIFALSALNYILNLEGVNVHLNEDNKELARDIWLRLKQVGLHLKDPPALFGYDTAEGAAN